MAKKLNVFLKSIFNATKRSIWEGKLHVHIFQEQRVQFAKNGCQQGPETAQETARTKHEDDCKGVHYLANNHEMVIMKQDLELETFKEQRKRSFLAPSKQQQIDW